MLVAQFDVPVRQINEVFPEVVLGCSKSNLDERPPFRSLRFTNQTHVRFPRKPITLSRVTRDAGANHIFPSRGAATVARDHVIQIKFATIEEVAAVLAGVLVSLKHVVPREFYFFLR